VVQDVFIYNREDHDTSIYRIVGSNLFIGDSSSILDNRSCGANINSTGMFNCGGRVGKYLGIHNYNSGEGFGHICRIQAWSIKANNFEFTTKQDRVF